MIDPVCAFHGKRKSEHLCLYCCLCFKDLTADICFKDKDGQKWDMCQECGERDGSAGGPRHRDIGPPPLER